MSLSALGQEISIEKYQLKLGEQLEIGTVMYQFNNVLSDSRCPKDVTCVMAGWATIEVKITQEGENANIKTVKIPAAEPSTANPELLVLDTGQRVLAGVLTPYPEANQAMEAREYALEIWLVTEH